MNQTNFLAELHTRTDEQAALEEQANEEFRENMQRQAQVVDSGRAANVPDAKILRFWRQRYCGTYERNDMSVT